MKLSTKQSGLSARQKTSISQKAMFRTTSLWVFLVASTLMMSCHEKTNGQNRPESKKESASIVQDTLNEPKVNIQVKKHYDDKGNVIGYDSTYTSFYSNINGDTSRIDSLMRSFDMYFRQDHSTFFGKDVTPFFFNDSLKYPDFFHDDLFLGQHELSDSYFQDMLDRMDSIRHHFDLDHSEPQNELKDL